MNLVGAHEIAAQLGLSRQRIHQLAAEDTFPRPVAALKMGKVWRASDVDRWMKKRRPGSNASHPPGRRS